MTFEDLSQEQHSNQSKFLNLKSGKLIPSLPKVKETYYVSK